MSQLYGDTTGLIHLTSSMLAVLFGTLVLVLNKGTKQHKQVGYAYTTSMIVLIITAFMIYRLFKGWGLFHYLTVVSLFTLLAGMIPVWFKQRITKWKSLHIGFMYWSVMGLYAAFAAETLTRIPNTPFFGMVGIATFFIMAVANIFFKKYQASWENI